MCNSQICDECHSQSTKVLVWAGHVNGKSLCLLSLALIIDWRVVCVSRGVKMSSQSEGKSNSLKIFLSLCMVSVGGVNLFFQAVEHG